MSIASFRACSYKLWPERRLGQSQSAGLSTMHRIGVIAAVSLALAGCGSFTPGNLLPFFGGYPLRLESDPPGAEATTSLGPSCRTPCSVAVPAREEFTVTFALAGYETQSATVGLLRSGGFGSENPSAVDFTPNPVVVVLEPAPPPQPVKKKKSAKAKPRASSKAPPPPSADRDAPPTATEAPAAQRTIPGS